MACFLVPAAEAVFTTAVSWFLKRRKRQQTVEERNFERNEEVQAHLQPRLEPISADRPESESLPFSVKLGWLNRMLWGGSALLALEHFWHGEIIPAFPFFTAVQNGEVPVMIQEMLTTGIWMAVLVTLVWAVVVSVSSFSEMFILRKSASFFRRNLT